LYNAPDPSSFIIVIVVPIRPRYFGGSINTYSMGLFNILPFYILISAALVYIMGTLIAVVFYI
jgi:hypothetical protein